MQEAKFVSSGILSLETRGLLPADVATMFIVKPFLQEIIAKSAVTEFWSEESAPESNSMLNAAAV